MLQRPSYQGESLPPDQEEGQLLSVSYFYDILKRRALHFAIPFVVILALGSILTLAWPAQYLSEGKILISSQEIPSDLVRPTVGTQSNERILYIDCLLYTSPSPRDGLLSRMPSSA